MAKRQGHLPPARSSPSRANAQPSPANAPAARLAARPPSDRESITIGLDLGTHSTKVVIRRGDSDETELLVLAPAPDNSRKYHPHADAPYPWFAIPSVVGIRSDHLIFGEEARALPEQDRQYALKACLLPDGPEVQGALLRRMKASSGGEVVDALLTAFAAWILELAAAKLDQRFGRGRWRPFVAMSAPMNHVEDVQLKERYERILAGAFHEVFESASERTPRTWTTARALALMRSYRGQHLPSPNRRRFVILPETVAAMVPVGRDPTVGPGLYHLIDIGGGTTENSVIWISEEGGVIECHKDESTPCGGISLRTEACAPDGPTLTQLVLSTQRVWTEGYILQSKNLSQKQIWARTQVLRSGGGWTQKSVRDHLEENHPAPSYFNQLLTQGLGFHPFEPSSAILRIDPRLAPQPERARDSTQLLPIAVGLALFPEYWPTWFGPSQIKPPPPDENDETPTDPFHGHA